MTRQFSPDAPIARPDVRTLARVAWDEADPDCKAAAARALAGAWARGDAALDAARVADGAAAELWPGRPARPRTVAPDAVPHRPANSDEGRIALMHAIAHIEFNAIDLALDAVWRFDGMPDDYYADWIRVADEEAQHFVLVRDWLRAHGADYGDCDAHDGLWKMAARTATDALARMALVPSVLEARGLDATPTIQRRLAETARHARNAGDARTGASIDAALSILDRILADEVGHVAIGRRWFEWLCARGGLDPDPAFEALMEAHGAPWPKPPINLEARRAAGFPETLLARFARRRTR